MYIIIVMTTLCSHCSLQVGVQLPYIRYFQHALDVSKKTLVNETLCCLPPVVFLYGGEIA